MAPFASKSVNFWRYSTSLKNVWKRQNCSFLREWGQFRILLKVENLTVNWKIVQSAKRSVIGPIYLQVTLIPIQAQRIEPKNGSLLTAWYYKRIIVLWDHMNGFSWKCQQQMILYEVSWMNHWNIRLYDGLYVPCYLWRTRLKNFSPRPRGKSVMVK